MVKLTGRQAECLEFIQTYVREHGYAPSQREVSRAMGGIRPQAVYDHLRALERKGVLRVTPGVARGIVLAARWAVAVVPSGGVR